MNKDKKEISFRKKALDHVSRPVLIDDVLQVISPKNWLLLFVLFFIMGFFLAWMIWGKLFIRVAGEGILMGVTQNIVSINSPIQDGIIKSIHVKVGDTIKKHSLMVSLDNELYLQMKLNKIYLDNLKMQQNDLGNRANTIVENLVRSQNEQIGKINSSLIAAQDKLKQLDIMLDLKEIALKKGIIDLPNVTETRIEYYKLLQEIRSHEADLISMKASMIDLRDKWRERQRDLAINIYKAEYDQNLLKDRWEQTNKIYSPVNGTVAEIRVQAGDYIKPGEVLISIISDNNELYVMAFVPATKGKLIKPGMTAQIQPTIINKLEYGSIRGQVINTSMLPVTSEYMLSLLKNQSLVDSFLSQGPLMSVNIMLDKNTETISGYQWTTVKGPDLKLSQGTLVKVMVNIKMKRPIDFLIHAIE